MQILPTFFVLDTLFSSVAIVLPRSKKVLLFTKHMKVERFTLPYNSVKTRNLTLALFD